MSLFLSQFKESWAFFPSLKFIRSHFTFAKKKLIKTRHDVSYELLASGNSAMIKNIVGHKCPQITCLSLIDIEFHDFIFQFSPVKKLVK